MNLLDRIKHNAMRILAVFSESPLLCSFLACIFAISSIFCIRGIVSGLFEMHRSRSNLKSIRKNYGFWQKVIMKPAWDKCIHAKTFCKSLIICHHIRIVLLLTSLFLAFMVNLAPSLMHITATFSGCVFFLIDLPVLILHVAMDRYPFQRLKHEYRFRKYHNTQNHDSLF